MSADSVLLERGEVATLTLNRPELGNVLDDDGLDVLARALREVGADPTCRLLLLRGAGEHFCRGREAHGGPLGQHQTAFMRRLSLERIAAVNDALQALDAITIAVVHGDALGFGCGLAVQCDFTLAADHATLGFPEINAGFPPTIVMSYLARYVPRKRAADLVLTGRRLSAAEAEAIGLVTRAVRPADLERGVGALVETLLGKNPLALRTAKQFLAEADDLTVAQAGRYGLNLLAVIQSAED
jgi:methylglutaconyl-CoA hydratase